MLDGDLTLELLFVDPQTFQKWPVCAVVKSDAVIVSQVGVTAFVDNCWNIPST